MSICKYMFINERIRFEEAENRCRREKMELATNCKEIVNINKNCTSKSNTKFYWIGFRECKNCNFTSRLVQWTKNNSCVDANTLPILSDHTFSNNCTNLPLAKNSTLILKNKETKKNCIKKAGVLCQPRTFSTVSSPKKGSIDANKNNEFTSTQSGPLKNSEKLNKGISVPEIGGIAGAVAIFLFLLIIIGLVKINYAKCKCKNKRKLEKERPIGFHTLQRHINLHLNKPNESLADETLEEKYDKSPSKPAIAIKIPETEPYVNFSVQDKVSSSNGSNEITYENVNSSPGLYLELDLQPTQDPELKPDPISLYASSTTSSRIYVNTDEKLYENTDVETRSAYSVEPIWIDEVYKNEENVEPVRKKVL